MQFCEQLDFELVAFRTFKKIHFCGWVFDPRFVVICYGSPREQKMFSGQDYEGPT